jgi:hypothetical protein
MTETSSGRIKIARAQLVNVCFWPSAELFMGGRKGRFGRRSGPDELSSWTAARDPSGTFDLSGKMKPQALAIVDEAFSKRVLAAARSSPKVLVVCKQLQCRVVACWNDPGQHQLEYCICKDRRMAHIEINRIEAVPHMQLRIIA